MNFGRDRRIFRTKTRFFLLYHWFRDLLIRRRFGLQRSENRLRNASLWKTGWLAMDTSHIGEHAAAAGSLFASIFVVATYTMRTMIPLRVFGMLTNIILIAASIASRNYPQLVLHAVLLPLNGYRLHQMLQLVRDVKKSVNSDLSMEWLKPFMTERKCTTGEVLFYKDEKAEDMFYIVSGRFKLVESGIELPVGAIVGEFGMLSPSNARTQTLECIEGGVILSVGYRQVEELYVQNPAFGFYFLRLVSARLFQNIGRLEERLAEHATPASMAASAGSA
jgi:CRP-like cAMP-binding protein